MIRIIIYILLCTNYMLGQHIVTKELSKDKVYVTEYYENGNVKQEGVKKYSLKLTKRPGSNLHCGIGKFWKHGKWKEYYESGQPKRIVKYKEGEEVREIKQWYKHNDLDSVRVLFNSITSIHDLELFYIEKLNDTTVHQNLIYDDSNTIFSKAFPLKEALQTAYNKSSFFKEHYLTFRLVYHENTNHYVWKITANKISIPVLKIRRGRFTIKSKTINIDNLGNIISYTNNKKGYGMVCYW